MTSTQACCSTSDKILFESYSNVIKLLLSWGYKCKQHDELIKHVKNGNIENFISYLKNSFVNYKIEDIHSEPSTITLWEKLISIWKHDVQGEKELLLYFSNYSDISSYKVSKDEAARAIRYLTLMKKKNLLFIYSNNISSMCQKHLSLLSFLTSGRYNVNTIYAPYLKIDPTQNFWVPKHTLIRYSPDFYENEGISRGTLPKIFQNDPGISHLDANVGDIIKIERMEEFEGISTIMFREVVKQSLDFNARSKKKVR